MKNNEKIKIKDTNRNNHCIKVKSLKATPSGLIHTGWATDLRNRMVRHFQDYDYQFLKIQATDDD
jgi:hypothetical protein